MLQRFGWKTSRRAQGCCSVLKVPGQLVLWEITHMQRFYYPETWQKTLWEGVRESLIQPRSQQEALAQQGWASIRQPPPCTSLQPQKLCSGSFSPSGEKKKNNTGAGSQVPDRYKYIMQRDRQDPGKRKTPRNTP